MKKEKHVNIEKQTERNNRIKDFLKSLIFPVILTTIILVGVFVVINYQNKPEEEEIIEIHAYAGDDKPIVMENEALKFTMDPSSTQFTVEVKDSHKIWYSNPEGAENDAAALPEEKNKLQSPLLISYAVETGLETSFNACVLPNKYHPLLFSIFLLLANLSTCANRCLYADLFRINISSGMGFPLES